MNKKILNYIEKCESWKVAIKNLHWSADNMSQHELCDDIASEISDFEDLVSEVEQSITGKIKLNGFTPKSYKIKSLRSFVEDVISDSQSFLKELDKMGEKYIGIKSECESFIGVMQRKLYLVNFTMKEDLKRRLSNRINESWTREENIKTTFHGTKPSTERGLFKRINDLTKNGQLNTRVFNGVDDAFEFYNKILGNMGTLQTVEPNESIRIVKLDTNGGMSYYGLMRTKDDGDGRCKASITFSPHSEEMEQPDPEMSEPTLEDCTNYEVAFGEGRTYRMTGNELHSLIEESVKNILEANGSGMDDRAWSNMEDLRYDRADHLADMRDKVKAQNVSGQLSGLKNQIVDRYRQQARHNIKQAKRNYGNHTELWNKEMDNLTKVPKFRPGDRIVMYGFEGVPLTVQGIEGENYICTDDYGRKVPIQISVQGSFTTV